MCIRFQSPLMRHPSYPSKIINFGRLSGATNGSIRRIRSGFVPVRGQKVLETDPKFDVVWSGNLTRRLLTIILNSWIMLSYPTAFAQDDGERHGESQHQQEQPDHHGPQDGHLQPRQAPGALPSGHGLGQLERPGDPRDGGAVCKLLLLYLCY